MRSPAVIRSLFLALFWLASGNCLAGELMTEVIALKERSAEELVPLLRPLLDAANVVEADGMRLIVRANQERIAELAEIVKQLDVAQAQFVVTLRFGRSNDRDGKQRTLQTKSRYYSHPTQLRVTEGRRAEFRLQRALPVVNMISLDPDHPLVAMGEKETADLIIVDALRHSRNVFLRVQLLKQLDNEGRASQLIDTRLKGPLGAWIQLNASEYQPGNQLNSHSYSTRRYRGVLPVQIRADLLD